jgi:hypothetical protein
LNPISFQISNDEIEPNFKSKQLFGCSFSTSENVTSDYNLKLSFTSEFGSAELTPNGTKIFSVNGAIYSPSVGPMTGNFNISIPFKSSSVNYNGYFYALHTTVEGIYQKIGQCNLFSSNLNCTFNSMNNLKKELFIKSKLDLLINNVRSLSLSPYFTFYRAIDVKEITPSRVIKTNAQIGYFNIFSSNEFTTMFGKFQVKYSMDSTEIIEECFIPSTTEMRCKIPSFSKIGAFSLQISQGNSIFENSLMMNTYDAIPISIQEFTPKEFSFSGQTEVFIFGNNFFNSSNITIKLSDQYIERISKGIFINGTLIKGIINPFFDLNVIFPRFVIISISFDGGLHYISSSIRPMLKKSDALEISPLLISVNDKSTITVKKFPGKNIYIENYRVDYFLTFNETYSVKLNCIFNETLNCTTESAPEYVGEYKLKLTLNEGSKFKSNMFFDILNSIQVYQFNLTSIEPSNVVMNKKGQLTLNGNWNTNLIKQVTFRFTFTNSSVLFSNEKIVSFVNGEIGEDKLTVDIPEMDFTASDISVDVSFNAVNFHPLNFNSKIQLYKITRVSNLEGLENNFLSFSNSKAKIVGERFVDTGKNLRLAFVLSTSKLDVTQIANLNVTSSSEIEFIFPNITLLNLNFQLGYPVKFDIGLSLNSGFDYVYSNVYYLDSNPQPTFTAIFPSVSPIEDKNITIFGLKLNLARNCSIYVNGDHGKPINLVFESPPQSVFDSENSLTCFIPKNVQTSVLYVFLKNQQGELNDVHKEIRFYGLNYFLTF